MIVQPKIRGFFCLTAHPAGCAAHVEEQIAWVRSRPRIAGPKNVLVVGGSTGYGLASRITAAFACEADTVGVFFEKPPTERKTGTAGWYNTAAFQRAARAAGRKAIGLNGDAFSDEIKTRTVERIREELGQIDLFVYSLASPRRTHPRTGEVARSVIKPIGKPYHGTTLDTDKRCVREVTIEPATPQEIAETVAVMGGEDWEMWIDALRDGGVAGPDLRTVAFTYIGTDVTWPIYWHGTIGKAKEDLDRATRAIRERLTSGTADLGVMKALVTQSSSAIPVVPLYISILYRVMKERGLHEGCIEQIYRLFSTGLYGDGAARDDEGRLRLDDLEMQPDVQQAVKAIWPAVTDENLMEVTDFDGYQEEFLKLFGFGLPAVDYEADVDPVVPLD